MEIPAEWSSIRVRPAASENEEHDAAAKFVRKRVRRHPPPATTRAEDDADETGAALCIGEEHTVNTKDVLAQSLRQHEIVEHNAVLQRVAETEGADGKKIVQLVEQVCQNLHNMVSLSSYHDVFANTADSAAELTRELRPLSKKFEDSMLRQPMHAGEHACVRGDSCECMFLDPACPFVGVELVLPWESKCSRKAGDRLCLPCLRAAALVLFLEITHFGKECPALVQRFYNEHSKPGEYALQAMLVAGPLGPVRNLPMPIVRHQRSNYHVHKENGIVYARQVRPRLVSRRDLRPAPRFPARPAPDFRMRGARGRSMWIFNEPPVASPYHV